MTKDEELTIIRAVLAGGNDRFEALVRAHEKGVYNLCLRTLQNPEDASDAAQEAFFRAWRSLPSFRGDSRFSVWLYRLASNICLDMLRKRSKTPQVPLENQEGEAWDLPDPAPSPQALAERRELRAAVDRALASLPEEFQKPVLLRDVSGLRYEEIAELLDLEPGTVKSRIFRGRRRLAEILTRDGNFSGYAPSEHREKGGQRHV